MSVTITRKTAVLMGEQTVGQSGVDPEGPEAQAFMEVIRTRPSLGRIYTLPTIGCPGCPMYQAGFWGAEGIAGDTAYDLALAWDDVTHAHGFGSTHTIYVNPLT